MKTNGQMGKIIKTESLKKIMHLSLREKKKAKFNM